MIGNENTWFFICLTPTLFLILCSRNNGQGTCTNQPSAGAKVPRWRYHAIASPFSATISSFGPFGSFLLERYGPTGEWQDEWYAFHRSAICTDSKVVKGICADSRVVKGRHIIYVIKTVIRGQNDCSSQVTALGASVPRLTTPWATPKSSRELYGTQVPRITVLMT